MLLNLSNHPSSKWSEKQMTTALNIYEAVVDLPFPQIPAQADEEEVCEIADHYMQKAEEVLKKHDKETNAVMLQGEFTFTYALVSGLLKKGIDVISACSERRVEETIQPDGSSVKLTVFSFVRFRRYTAI